MTFQTSLIEEPDEGAPVLHSGQVLILVSSDEGVREARDHAGSGQISLEPVSRAGASGIVPILTADNPDRPEVGDYGTDRWHCVGRTRRLVRDITVTSENNLTRITMRSWSDAG